MPVPHCHPVPACVTRRDRGLVRAAVVCEDPDLSRQVDVLGGPATENVKDSLTNGLFLWTRALEWGEISVALPQLMAYEDGAAARWSGAHEVGRRQARQGGDSLS